MAYRRCNLPPFTIGGLPDELLSLEATESFRVGSNTELEEDALRAEIETELMARSRLIVGDNYKNILMCN